MRKVSTARQFQSGLESSADSMISGVGGILADPVAGVSGTVSGVKKLFGRLDSSVSGDDAEDQDDLLGYDKAKRVVAAAYGVNVYSSNAVLQAEIERLAKAHNVGGLTLSGALAPVGGAAGIALSATSATVKLNEMVRDMSVAELKDANAAKLAAMGVSQDLIDLFLDAPALSPSQQTAIVGALGRMDGAKGRELVVKQAILTDSEDVARFRVLQLAMYLVHHENTAKVTRFVPAGRYVVGAVDGNGNLSVAMPIDYMAWTRDVAGIAMSAGGVLAKVDGVKSRTLRVTGTVSPASRSALEGLGWSVVEQFKLKQI
jgi:hypothetical protein